MFQNGLLPPSGDLTQPFIYISCMKKVKCRIINAETEVQTQISEVNG
ncbi:hypothetical protein L798_03652 [Zootermopsis nevadensis]|uniref:Uncharacterized protein n=1 Tax=Zootermopsis nevadensis TaxID=136037 RepID=A0A067QFW4_ZOONE|nr:hypothetical protein L798_03652 [Zootermopsis nevadensis]